MWTVKVAKLPKTITQVGKMKLPECSSYSLLVLPCITKGKSISSLQNHPHRASLSRSKNMLNSGYQTRSATSM